MIGGKSGKLPGASVDRLEHWSQAVFAPETSHQFLAGVPQRCDLHVTEPVVLRLVQHVEVERCGRRCRRHLVDENYLVEEPGVNPRCDEELTDRGAGAKCLLDCHDSTIGWPGGEGRQLRSVAGFSLPVE